MPNERPPSLVLRVLGTFDAELNGTPITDALSPQATWLLALLVMRGSEVLSRTTVAACLWPEDNSSDGGTVKLRHHLMMLRRALGDAAATIVRTEGRTGLWVARETVELDARAFQEASAKALQTRGLDLLKEAADRYRGELLPGHELPWIRQRREQLQREYLDVLETLVTEAIAHSDRDRALRGLQTLLQQDPVRPSAVRHLMSLTAEHDLVGTTRIYQEYRQRLASIGKSALRDTETTRLYQRLMRQQGTIKTSQQPTIPDLPRHVALPTPITSLVGRDQEIHEIVDRLATMRLITLIGSGGVGKTRLAQEAAHHAEALFAHGAAFVDLSDLPADTREERILQQITDALPVGEAPDSRLLNTIMGILKPREFLLVLDNCEQNLEWCSDIVELLLTSCPGLRVLATSREPLQIVGQQTYRVPSLSFPSQEETITPGAPARYEAVRLFVERAGRPGYALTAANAPTVAWICRALDGIPLAIEMAAATLDLLTEAEIAQRMRASFWFLARPEGTPVSRHQTLHAMIDWSGRLLSPHEHRLFARLSVLCGHWNAEAARAVQGVNNDVDAMHDALGRLCRKSLILRESHAETSRFRMAAPIRQYALERLEAEGGDPEARNRHLAHFISVAEKAERRLTGDEALQWLDLLDQDRENLNAALDWAYESRAFQPGLRLAETLWRYWYLRGRYTEGLGQLQRFLDAIPEVAATALRAQNGIGNLAYASGQHARARVHYERCLEMRRASGNPFHIAAGLANLANVVHAQGDPEEAARLFEESLRIFRELDDRRGIALALMNLGTVSHDQQHYARALELHQAGLTLFRELKDAQNLTLALNNLTNTLLHLDDYAAALPLMRECHGLCLTLGNPQRLANCYTNHFLFAVRCGDMEAAVTLYGMEREFRRRHQTPLPDAFSPIYQENVNITLRCLGTRPFSERVERAAEMTQADRIAYLEQIEADWSLDLERETGWR
jgi:predicted ATPase/DNA-binding SARP family transcriptional activator